MYNIFYKYPISIRIKLVANNYFLRSFAVLNFGKLFDLVYCLCCCECVFEG